MLNLPELLQIADEESSYTLALCLCCDLIVMALGRHPFPQLALWFLLPLIVSVLAEQLPVGSGQRLALVGGALAVMFAPHTLIVLIVAIFVCWINAELWRERL